MRYETEGQIKFNFSPNCGDSRKLIIPGLIEDGPKSPLKENIENEMADREWKIIEGTREDLRKSDYRGHIFYIPKNTAISSTSKCPQREFFRGKLNQAVLGITDKDHKEYLQLRPLESDLITIFFSNEWGDGKYAIKKIPINSLAKCTKPYFDLTGVAKDEFVSKIFR